MTGPCKILISCSCLVLIAAAPGSAQEEPVSSKKSGEKTAQGREASASGASSQQPATGVAKGLDADDLFGGVNFIKGIGSKQKAYRTGSDELIGTVTATTNPYTSIPKPTGMIMGRVYVPDKDGKVPSSSGNMLSGLGLLIQAMNAGSDN